MKETSKRVAALTKMRKEMNKRFYLLYRYFRFKKYSEPLPSADDDFDFGEIEDFCDDDDKALLRRIHTMQK